MTLLERLLSYAKDTKKIRDDYENEVATLKRTCSVKLTEKDNERKSYLAKISELDKKSKLCMENIHSRVAYECKDFLIKSMPSLATFDPNDVINPESKAAATELSVYKQELKEYLTTDKKIKEQFLPLNTLEQQHLKGKLEQDLLEAKSKESNLLDSVRNPLIRDYNNEVKRCTKNYVFTDSPLRAEILPEAVAIGNYIVKSTPELAEITSASPIKVPCDVSMRSGGNVILKIDSNHLYDNNNIIENIIAGMSLKYIESFPSGHLKLGIYSSSITSFGKLSALFAAAFKGKMTIMPESCKTREQFARLLLTISQKGEMINSKLLENNCLDLYDLYEQDIKTESFQLVIVHDVFRDMTVDNINQFHGCISELQRCGIRFIIIDDFDEEIYRNKPPAFMSKLNQILEICQVFTLDGNTIYDSNRNPLELISAEGLGNNDIFNFINKYCVYATETKAPYVSYDRIGFGTQDPDPSVFNSIVVPVALNDPNIWNIEFTIAGDAPDANFVVGLQGTGKSTLLDSLIMNGAMKYSPDDLIFHLLDFKDGASSSTYTMPENQIPHVKVVSSQNKQEDAEIILSNILAESERRNNEFKALAFESGVAVKSIAEYNQLVATGKYGRKKMPRLIIIIDECQYLFEDDTLAAKCQNIVRKCRSQAIHLVLATQALSHKMWSTIKFFKGIYAFEIAKDDAEQLLDRKYASIISNEIPKGSYMAFASNNGGSICTKIKVAFDGGQTAKYAKQIREKWSNYPIELAIIGDKGPNVISSKEYEKVLESCKENEFVIGENYNDHRPLTFCYKQKRPMFLCGTYQHAADSMMKTVGFVAAKRNIETYLVDASYDQKVSKYFEKVKSDNFHIYDETGYLEALEKVYNIYKEREGNPRGEHKPVFFIVNSLQSIVDFLNNKKKVVNLDEQVPEGLSVNERIAYITALKAQAASRDSSAFSGRDTLIPLLLSNCYKVNIFICLSTDSISLTSDLGEPVLQYSQQNIIKLSEYKLLYPNCNGNIRNIMEDTFKEKMLNSLSNDMAFLSFEQRDFYKIRYYQLDEEE